MTNARERLEIYRLVDLSCGKGVQLEHELGWSEVRVEPPTDLIATVEPAQEEPGAVVAFDDSYLLDGAAMTAR